MHIISLFCLTSLRIFFAFDGQSCISTEKRRFVKLKRTKSTAAYIDQILSDKKLCKSHRSTSNVEWPVPVKCYVNSKCSVHFKQTRRYRSDIYRNISFQCTSCLSSVADTTVAITCPSNTAVHIDEKFHKTYGGSIYSTFQDFTFSENNYNNACKDSLICTIVTRTAYKKNASVNWICKGRNRVPGHDTDMYGIPDYVFILGGISGVFIITCIIVAVFLLRKNNCNEFRNTQMTINDQIMPTVNSTYTPAWRSNKHENHHQAHLVNAPGGSNLSTTPAVYFDNRTNDKAIKLCPIQQPGNQTNKHESNTYSHLRTTTNDSDDMYDHTVRNPVRNTCDGDYGVAHIRINEDDYNVSGTCHHPLTIKEDPFYT